jgi:hypothetical protein
MHRAAERRTTLGDVAESSSDLSDDFVDLERLKKARFLFQIRTPFRQDPIGSLFLVIALINNLLDGNFPWFKTHRPAVEVPTDSKSIRMTIFAASTG